MLDPVVDVFIIGEGNVTAGDYDMGLKDDNFSPLILQLALQSRPWS